MLLRICMTTITVVLVKSLCPSGRPTGKKSPVNHVGETTSSPIRSVGGVKPQTPVSERKMKAYIFLKDKSGENQLLARVENLEVVPRGTYVIDGVEYQYTGQPTFIIEKMPYLYGGKHQLTRVEFFVEKKTPET